MSIAETYLDAARKFVPDDRSQLATVAKDLRSWVRNQARSVRELGSPERLRCLTYITLPRRDGELVSVEFLVPRGDTYTLLIASSGRNILAGRAPHTVSLNASLTLLALLAEELGVAVKLQP